MIRVMTSPSLCGGERDDPPPLLTPCGCARAGRRRVDAYGWQMGASKVRELDHDVHQSGTTEPLVPLFPDDESFGIVIRRRVRLELSPQEPRRSSCRVR